VIEFLGRGAGIVLAAGGSTRLGRPKPLLPWQGRTLIEHVVRQAQTIGLDDLIVVTGAAGDQVAQAVGDHARVVLNPKWMDGQSSSLQVGLRALRPHAAAALFILADQPDLRPEVARLLIARWQATRAPVVVPRYQGRRGNPAIFDRATFGDLLALRGDVGGRPVIEAYGEAVEWIDVPLAPPADIDTPEEYERMLLAM
jgi:molybdenum cofactor cytidylyltransferase